MIVGHILVEALLSDNKWYLIDSTAGKFYLDYDRNNMSIPGGYYVFAKSIEVFDTGVKDQASNSRVMLELFDDFDINKYQATGYNFVNLY